jgi:ribonucleotide monophosphatase NagD (HAD superfamily)
LQTECGIDLMKSEFDELATHLTNTREATHLLVYLQTECGVDLMKSEFDELAAFLTNARQATHFIFTNAHKQAYLTKLQGNFSQGVLCAYYNEFNGSAEAEAGKPMPDGIKAFGRSLGELDEETVIIFSIG